MRAFLKPAYRGPGHHAYRSETAHAEPEGRNIQQNLNGGNGGNGNPETAGLFRRFWSNVTNENILTLSSFRRFRTGHLSNLRLLDLEIEKLDNKFFEARPSLELPVRSEEKLGLKHSRRDSHAVSEHHNHYELYKTGLVRFDTQNRSCFGGILRRTRRKCLRAFLIFVRSGGHQRHPQKYHSSAAEMELHLKGS